MSLLAIAWGPWEITLVLAVFLLLFGGAKLPKLARSLGSSLTEFKKGLRGDPDSTDEKKVPEESSAKGGDDEKPT